MSLGTLQDGQLDNAIMFPLASLPGNPDMLVAKHDRKDLI